MSYAEIMICAYATTNGISREEAIHSLKLEELAPAKKELFTGQVEDQRIREILDDLRKDPKGIHAWRLK